MLTEEEIKKLWGETTRKHQITDGSFRTAVARAIEQATAKRCAEIARNTLPEAGVRIAEAILPKFKS